MSSYNLLQPTRRDKNSNNVSRISLHSEFFLCEGGIRLFLMTPSNWLDFLRWLRQIVLGGKYYENVLTKHLSGSVRASEVHVNTAEKRLFVSDNITNSPIVTSLSKSHRMTPSPRNCHSRCFPPRCCLILCIIPPW